MRCPDCNKFVSYDEPECDLQSVEVYVENVSAIVIVNLNCQDCGTTLKSCEIEAQEEIVHKCKEGAIGDMEEGDAQYEVENEGDPEGDTRMETKDRHGKPIKSSRYMKTFYGFTIAPEIKCRLCGETFTIALQAEEQASSFEEVC